MRGYLLNGVARIPVFAPADEGAGGGGAPIVPVAPVVGAVVAEPAAGAAAVGEVKGPTSILSDAKPGVVETPEAKTARVAAETKAAETLTAARQRVELRTKETAELRAAREKTETPAQKEARLADEGLVGEAVKKDVAAARDRLALLAKETPDQKTAREKTETADQKTAREADEKLVKDQDAATRAVLVKSYEAIKLPDGMPRDQPAFVDFLSEAAEQGIPADKAQNLVDKVAPKLQAAVNAPYELWANTVTGWIKSAESDPEYGGKDYEANLGYAAVFINKLGGKEADKLREALAFTGAGNHPELIRAMIRGGRLLSEGGPAGGAGNTDTRTLGERAYPNMKATT